MFCRRSKYLPIRHAWEIYRAQPAHYLPLVEKGHVWLKASPVRVESMKIQSWKKRTADGIDFSYGNLSSDPHSVKFFVRGCWHRNINEILR